MHFTRVLWWPAKMTIQSARKCALPIFEHVSTSVKSDSLMLIQYQWCHPMRFCWKIAINYNHRKNNVNYNRILSSIKCMLFSPVSYNCFIYRISKADQINIFTVFIIKFYCCSFNFEIYMYACIFWIYNLLMGLGIWVIFSY